MPAIKIIGPAASGKTTLAKRIKEILEEEFIETGLPGEVTIFDDGHAVEAQTIDEYGSLTYEYIILVKEQPEQADKQKDIDNGASLIATERTRQIAEEGYSNKHDDMQGGDQLALAAICYAAPSFLRDFLNLNDINCWPWDIEYFKPSGDRIKDLTKAGSLIAAEIDRLLRLKEAQP